MPNRPIWRLVETSAHELTAAGRSPFTRRDLISCIQAIDPSIGADSINPIIQGVTDNLKGGAPGAVGRDILHSIARGQFVLRQGSLDTPWEYEEPTLSKPRVRNADRSDHYLPTLESELRDLLIAQLAPKLPEIRLESEGSVQYSLPSGRTMSHASDILATKAGSAKSVSIELKYRSAVTDQFKARAYDAAHMKRTHGDRILTVLVFAKSDTGISIDRARDIGHEFDRFYGDAVQAFLEPAGIIDELACEIGDFLLEG